MPKYIRIENNICEVLAEERTFNHLSERYEMNYLVEGDLWYNESEIIAGPTEYPKELCDEFMIFSDMESKKPLAIDTFYNIMTYYHEKDYVVFGSIWIIGEKGEPILVPVFKMNKEGKLCLI